MIRIRRLPALTLILTLTLALTLLSACGDAVPPASERARILAMGDSLLAWNGLSGQSIPDVVERSLKEPVVDRSVIGARMIYRLPISGAAGLSIPKQYRPGPWDWVILNGGGNDLWFGCGCGMCAQKLDKLLREDGRGGAIAEVVQRIRRGGARVVYVGYLRSPGRSSPIEACKDEGDALDARVALLAERDEGVYFLSLADLVPHRDLSFHAADRVHPSLKAGRVIGQRIAAIIRGAP
ncbi:MAG: GDSL family lipase [Alphaproteobacteria bacterium MedPE-SWcel]|nr:MAG: GDSL family lipase [Alphaproteobacteria bacterium MedPE-SWcel]